jgi:hypothetical protein
MLKNIAIIGSSGALGHALITQISLSNPDARIHAFTSKEQHAEIQNVTTHIIYYSRESAIESAALLVSKDGPLGLVILATGILHEGDLLPEKSLKSLSAEKMQYLFAVNTILPSLIAKYFSPVFLIKIIR